MEKNRWQVETLRKKIIFRITALVLATLFTVSLFFWLEESLRATSNSSDIGGKVRFNDYEALSNGDIVFRVGNGFWTPFFVKANRRHGYSHVGVVIFENRLPYVLHAEADDVTLIGGIKKTFLNTFIAESTSYVIKKNKMPGREKAMFISELLKMQSLNLEFDDRFDVDDDGKKLYCTEFVWLAAKRAGLNNFGIIEAFFGKLFIFVDSIYESPLLGEKLYSGNRLVGSVGHI